jgi:hypothetical protein
MEPCDKCAKLEGAPADFVREAGMTLGGVGQCSGVVAIEHYRCDDCGTLMIRQLAGDPTDQIWTAIAIARKVC